jgi:hypothetical protein
MAEIWRAGEIRTPAIQVRGLGEGGLLPAGG